jgi:hypothetical protein
MLEVGLLGSGLKMSRRGRKRGEEGWRGSRCVAKNLITRGNVTWGGGMDQVQVGSSKRLQ